MIIASNVSFTEALEIIRQHNLDRHKSKHKELIPLKTLFPLGTGVRARGLIVVCNACDEPDEPKVEIIK